MKVNPISKPLPGERAIAIVPELTPQIQQGDRPRHRLNFFTGRSLSDVALGSEQLYRTTRLNDAGRAISPGVIRGLEVTLTPTGDEYLLSSGCGLTRQGDSVVVPREQRFAVENVLTPEGNRFGEIDENDDTFPSAGVLVLEPVTVEIRGEFDDKDQCEEDPQNYAYEDWQQIDGCRVTFVPWSAELPLPERTEPAGLWRNLLAAAIFQHEADGGLLPWDDAGLPVALVGLDAERRPLFVDRHAVVRTSGAARLAEARIGQFHEQFAQQYQDGLSAAEQAEHFRLVPPVALLPKDAVTFGTRTEDGRPIASRFFPENYRVELVPAVAEQLDVLPRQCSSLAPFDLTQPDHVKVLVPVPQAVYEPDLLQIEAVSPEFHDALAEFVNRRAEWLRRREVIREVATAFVTPIRGQPPEFPDPDPGAVEEDETVADEVDPPEEPFGTEVNDGERAVTVFEELRAAIGDSELSDEEKQSLDELGLLRYIRFLEDKVQRADDKIDIGFARFMTDNYRIRQLMLGSEGATRLATSPVFVDVAKGETAAATKEEISLAVEALKGSPEGSFARTSPERTTPDGESGETTADPRTKFVLSGGTTFTGLRGDTFSLEPSIDSATLADFTVIETVPPSEIELIKDQTTATSELLQAKSLVYGQNYLVGKPELFRTTTLAERLKNPPSNEAKNAAVANLYQAVRSILDLDIAVGGIIVTGLPAELELDEKSNPPTLRFLSEDGRAERILNYPDPADGDEASFFSVTVDILEHTVALYRRTEGLVQRYRELIARCRQTLDKMTGTLRGVDRRANVIDDELAEARHDVSVARTLLAEEQDRVNAVNERRDRVLEAQVDYLAYCRPRTVQLHDASPIRQIDPGLTEEPRPACLARNVEIPDELREFAGLFRDSPVKWFPKIAEQLEKLERPQILRDTMRVAKRRAATFNGTRLSLALQSTGTLGQAIGNLYAAQNRTIAAFRQQTAFIDFARLQSFTWQQARDTAQEIVTLGDLIDAPHGRSQVAQRVTTMLDEFSHLAGCLYSLFGDVTPALRLTWAERLSQFDAPVNLRNLATLPRWGEVEYQGRRQIQTLADYLYQQVDPAQADAVSLISDLVRICILLASHAPVNRIIVGHVDAPTTVRKGGEVKVKVDAASVRIGMPMILYQADRVVARGVVQDMSGSYAAARIVQALEIGVQVNQGARVQFGGLVR